MNAVTNALSFRQAAVFWRGVSVRNLRAWPVFSVIVLSTLAVVAIGAPWITGHDPEGGDLRDRNIAPLFFGGTTEHVFGTDQIGRDLFSRVVFGSRISLLVASVSLVFSGIIGAILGMVAGYGGRWADEAIMRFTEITLAIPLVLVALALALVLGPSLAVVLGVLSFLTWGRIARQVRGETLSLKEREYVQYARATDASGSRILIKHIFPGVFNTLVVVLTLQVGSVILAEATLSFLGAGIPPPTPAWGSMIAEGQPYIISAWWVSVVPGLTIGATVMAFLLLGDWLRDRLDPMLRQL